MNDQSNAPLSSESAGSAGVAGWFSTWMTAVTKPNEQTFATLAEHPDAKTNSRALTWVFLAGTISALISGVFQAILQLAGFASQTPGLSDLFGGDAQRGVAFTLGIAICSSPVVGALVTLFFAIGVGVLQWIASMFKGTGTFSQLAYAIATFYVPISLVSSILTPLNAIPYVNYCTGLFGILLSLYAFVLEVMAVKGVNKFGWGQAIGTVLIPVVVFICCVVVIAIGMASLGVAIGETFNQINNSLAP